MQNKIQICNRALRLIKQKNISSLEEKTKEGQSCAFLYPQIKIEVLASYLWKCAIKNIYLKALYNTNGNMNYQYKFILPSNCLRVLKVNGEDYFIRCGNVLYSNDCEVDIIYIANIKEEEMSNYIGYLIAIKLAIELGYDFLNEDVVLSRLYSLYHVEFNKSTGLDSQEGSNILSEYFENPSWISAREF